MKFYSPEQIVDDDLEFLNHLPEVYVEQYIPRRYGQPHYVEVWVEKKAMGGVLKSILEDYEVKNRTYGWMDIIFI